MKAIIAGSREIEDYDYIVMAVEMAGLDITEVVSGGARGVDRLGELWAEEHKVPCKQFLPDWNGPLGKGAGFARNIEMAEYGDALIAVWNGNSKGTQQMISEMRKRTTEVYVLLVLEV